MASSKSLILLTVLLLVGVRSACRDGKSFLALEAYLSSFNYMFNCFVLFCFFFVVLFGVVVVVLFFEGGLFRIVSFV